MIATFGATRRSSSTAERLRASGSVRSSSTALIGSVAEPREALLQRRDVLDAQDLAASSRTSRTVRRSGASGFDQQQARHAVTVICARPLDRGSGLRHRVIVRAILLPLQRAGFTLMHAAAECTQKRDKSPPDSGTLLDADIC